MNDEEIALHEFKNFVASIEYTTDHYILAAKLGEAKALWAKACDLDVVRQSVSKLRYQEPKLDDFMKSIINSLVPKLRR